MGFKDESHAHELHEVHINYLRIQYMKDNKPITFEDV